MKIDKAQIQCWYVAEHLSISEISRRTGLCRKTIKGVLHEANIRIRSFREQLGTPEDDLIEPIRHLYFDCGLSLQKVAWQIKHSPKSIMKILERAGLPRRDKHEMFRTRNLQRQKELAPEIIRLYQEEGLSIVKIAQKLMIGRTAIRSILRRANIPLRQYTLKFINPAGYVAVRQPKHARANKAGYVLEHILVWEATHKPLPDGFIIHHLNGIKTDNRPENLIALSEKKHSHILKAKAKRIEQLEKRVTLLEAEIILLQEALKTGQMLFTIREN